MKELLVPLKPDEAGVIHVEKRVLIDLLVNRLAWRAYALALEAAGTWR